MVSILFDKTKSHLIFGSKKEAETAQLIIFEKLNYLEDLDGQLFYDIVKEYREGWGILNPYFSIFKNHADELSKDIICKSYNANILG
jgi:hypothetical protein